MTEMAIKKLHNGVQVGDYVRGRWHNVSPSWRDTWRKVIDRTEDDTLILQDRNGTVREKPHQSWLKWLVWEPGDPQEDGDNM
jgi:hypothetical protein